jgi:DNA helicase INO80
MQIPEAKRLIYDSAKLARLDALLQELKAGDHRVLIYFQMTRMMDLMEEYLIYRQYKYLRLDGSSKLEDRRDMVMDWQTRSDIFIFILSTRAGGLGINLTAADTVIFYDHDWNPSNDAQAMDRAHRLGQTRQVTVYRLITKGTIDERIIQLARVKKDVQDIVVGNKNFTDVTKPSEIVQLLLNDDQLANLDSSNTSGSSSKKTGKQVVGVSEGSSGDTMRDLWNEEGDDFFGHSSNNNVVAAPPEGVEEEEGTTAPAKGKKRKAGAARPRKTTGKGSRKKDPGTGDVTPAVDAE